MRRQRFEPWSFGFWVCLRFGIWDFAPGRWYLDADKSVGCAVHTVTFLGKAGVHSTPYTCGCVETGVRIDRPIAARLFGVSLNAVAYPRAAMFGIPVDRPDETRIIASFRPFRAAEKKVRGKKGQGKKPASLCPSTFCFLFYYYNATKAQENLCRRPMIP